MDETIPVNRAECRADELKPGVRVAAGFLPLRKAAEILFAYPYQLHGTARVLVVYLYDGDGQPAPDDFLAESLIPLEVGPIELSETIRRPDGWHRVEASVYGLPEGARAELADGELRVYQDAAPAMPSGVQGGDWLNEEIGIQR